MSKQDRQAVRTAVDVEIKYGLGKQKSSQGLTAKQEERINQLSQTIQQYTNKTNGYIDELNNEVGELETAVGNVNKEIEELKDNQPISPTVTVTDIEGGHRVTITDINGTKSFDVMDGEGGGTGGADGEDGISPTIDIAEIEGGHKVTITDVNGTETFNVMNGVDGKDGEDGADGKDSADVSEVLPSIPSGADANDYLEVGGYSVGGTTVAQNVANLPFPVAGRLFVSSSLGVSIPTSGYSYLRQKYVPYQLNYPVCEREVSRGSDNVWQFGSWIPTSLNGQKILWSGGSQMGDGETITLTEKISQQPNGIVLVFSYVDSAGNVGNYYYSHHRVDKAFVSARNGTSSIFFLNLSTFSLVGAKLLAIYDDKITGHADNSKNGTAQSGITYNNTRWALRYVLGV